MKATRSNPLLFINRSCFKPDHQTRKQRGAGNSGPIRPNCQKFQSAHESNYEVIHIRPGIGTAIIAMNHKFLGIIYQTLKNNWVFEDLPDFALAKSKASQ